MTPERRAVKVVLEFQDAPPSSPRRRPPLAILIAEEIRAAVAEEREACAKLCDEESGSHTPGWTETMNNIQNGTAAGLARAIRARSR